MRNINISNFIDYISFEEIFRKIDEIISYFHLNLSFI